MPVAQELLTVPNALTASRLVATEQVATRLEEDPAKWWAPTAAFMFSDIADGTLARLGDKSDALARVGLRRSEIGRMLDPVTDTYVGSRMVLAGMRTEVIPKSIALAALGQKALKTYHALQAARQGANIQVSKLGKRSEFATNLGLGSLFAAESIKDPSVKSKVRAVAMAVGLVGIAGAAIADRKYAYQAREATLDLPLEQ
jgi:phosphatidylglycerophosphate synthase